MNYDASNVGVPFIRAHRIEIEYPDSNGKPVARVHQSLAVVLADGSTRTIQQLMPIEIVIDLKNHGDDPIPLVSPTTAQNMGADTSLNKTFLSILAVVRQAQIAAETP